MQMPKGWLNKTPFKVYNLNFIFLTFLEALVLSQHDRLKINYSYLQDS